VSAICGLLHLDGTIPPPSRDAIAAMSAALAHRGPHGDGSWMDERAALAHRMLHTTAESLIEVQPVVRQREGLTLVADARIDNRDELTAILGIPRDTRPSDSEIIAAAYLRWGPECVHRLVGDFAFAIWNARYQTLFCARDPMGVKPLYFARPGRAFAFASEIKALFTIPDVDAAIDAEQVALFLGWSQDDPSRTIYKSVMRLPAGHTLLVSAERFAVRRYWNPESAGDVRFSSDAEYVGAFRDRFEAAVSARLRSAYPVGATLSGGLDSSSVVCMSRRLRGESAPPLHTFSVVFPSLPQNELNLIDEREYVDAVLHGGSLQPHFIRGDELTPLHDIRRILWHLDEPHSAPNLYLHWGMFEAASNSGVRILLDGFDGDTAVSHGFGRLTGLARAGEYDTLESEIASFSKRHGKAPELALRTYVLPHLTELVKRRDFGAWYRAAATIARRFRIPRRELLKQYGLRPLLPASLGAAAVGDADRSVRELLRPALARTLRRHTRRQAISELRRPLASEREAHLQGLLQPGYQMTLDLADRSAAAFGLETRYPFFDRRVIEFCLGLPEEQKFAGGWPRLLLRRAMDGILPPEIQWRTTKANLSPNFHRRFRAGDAARRDQFDGADLSRYVRPDLVREMAARYRARGDGQDMKLEALTLFRTSIFAEWLDGLTSGTERTRLEAGMPAPAAA
jgi:asparagine synthase (glutamine-hydrolysing)